MDRPEYQRERWVFKKACRKGQGLLRRGKGKALEGTDIYNQTCASQYRELEQHGIIELTTSPYYHPILPLLCDSHLARESMPNIELPKKRFHSPEDAREQIRRGIMLFQDTFGKRPKGMWPPEGSVSEVLIPIVAEEGINWIATDEEILAHSLKKTIRRDVHGNCLDPETLYKPYNMTVDGKKISIIFRDHTLSDLIGFVYAPWDAEKAANDFINRLMKIYSSLGNPEGYLVSIILDGENAC